MCRNGSRGRGKVVVAEAGAVMTAAVAMAGAAGGSPCLRRAAAHGIPPPPPPLSAPSPRYLTAPERRSHVQT